MAAFCVLLIAGSGLIHGCASTRETRTSLAVNQPQAPIPCPVLQTPAAEEGSLWQNVSLDLFMDPKACKVGDTVTVDIVENTSSKIDANTDSARTSSIDGGVSHLGGYMRALEAANPNLGKDQTNALSAKLLKADMTNSFKGKGSSDRSGRITASIGARVVDVLPGGNLVLFGRREMKVNNEVQYITVSGIVRRQDIGADNRIKSTYLADARIEYIGQGVIADKQRPGWGTRLVDKVWPF
ncbi:MAG: flagellar basal body L-ring protein FlgH [Deltaproteobacteria bacterium]|nr:flagellar basal body L-ring protein FlgH [Deltaproteobacteria bacterium]